MLCYYFLLRLNIFAWFCRCRLSGSCNHIVGVLLRIEGAVRIGLSRPSATSRVSLWNVPKVGKLHQPIPVEELSWTKSHYQHEHLPGKDIESGHRDGISTLYC
jgi:hypothetical protein